jgi:hypothetical protein
MVLCMCLHVNAWEDDFVHVHALLGYVNIYTKVFISYFFPLHFET